MLEYISWIFSGIGVSILSRIWPEKYKSQISNKVKGNNNRVAGRNIVNDNTPITTIDTSIKVKNDIEGDNNEVAGRDIKIN